MSDYDPDAYPRVAVTVDLVVFTIRDDELCGLMIRRGEAPQKGRWALPGGFVREGEDLEHAAARELAEETGLTSADVHIEQLGTYGDPHRDPRMRVITVAYLALAPDLPLPRAGSDAAAAHWMPLTDLLDDRPPTRLRPPRDLARRSRPSSREARIHAASQRVLRARVHRRRASSRLRDRLGN